MYGYQGEKWGVEGIGRLSYTYTLCIYIYTIDTVYKIDNSCFNFGY